MANKYKRGYMVYNTYTFGDTPDFVLEAVVPETYNVELKNRDAILVNTLLFNKTDRYLKQVFDKLGLIKLLNSLKSVAIENTSFWSREESDIAYSLRSSILLTLGIEEV